MTDPAQIAHEHHQDELSREEIEALTRRMIPYQTAKLMVCEAMQCASTSFYKYYKQLLQPFSLGGGGQRARFCWEDEVLRAIALCKGHHLAERPVERADGGREVEIDTRAARLDFGPHAGELVSDLSGEYLSWVVQMQIARAVEVAGGRRYPAWKVARAELARRGTEEAGGA